MNTLTNFFLAILVAVSGASAQDLCVTDACIKPSRDHSLMQREVRGLRDELKALSRTVRDGVQVTEQDGPVQDVINSIVGSGSDSSSSDSPNKHEKKSHGGHHSKSKSKHHNGSNHTNASHHNGSNHTNANTSNHSQKHGHSGLAKGNCVVTHWVSDHDGQPGTITDIKKNNKFFSVFFKDQHMEWIPKEYLTPTDCPKVQVHDCVKVDWVSDHDGELGRVLDMQEHHGEQVCKVQFEDAKEEWIPAENLNYSFKSCPPVGQHVAHNHSNSSAHTLNHSHKHSNVSAHKHNHSHNISHNHSDKNESNSSAHKHNHSHNISHNHSHNVSHNHSHQNKSNSSAHKHNHTHSASHKSKSNS